MSGVFGKRGRGLNHDGTTSTTGKEFDTINRIYRNAIRGGGEYFD
jgi:hypothetical protein